MKNFRLLALLLLVAPLAVAQETLTIPLSAADVVRLDIGRKNHNRNRCVANNVFPVDSCTQAQVCVAAGVAGGASCTALDAILAGQRIYPDSAAGRNSFGGNESIRAGLPGYVQAQAEVAMGTLRLKCINPATTQIEKDAICTSFGASAGCGICDNFQ